MRAGGRTLTQNAGMNGDCMTFLVDGAAPDGTACSGSSRTFNRYELLNCSVLMLQGTRERRIAEIPAELISCGKFDRYVNDNKHAGVSVSVKSSEYPRGSVFAGEPCLAGRALAVRSVRRHGDCTFLSMYFPPVTSTGVAIKITVFEPNCTQHESTSVYSAGFAPNSSSSLVTVTIGALARSGLFISSHGGGCMLLLWMMWTRAACSLQI